MLLHMLLHHDVIVLSNDPIEEPSAILQYDLEWIEWKVGDRGSCFFNTLVKTILETHVFE